VPVSIGRDVRAKVFAEGVPKVARCSSVKIDLSEVCPGDLGKFSIQTTGNNRRISTGIMGVTTTVIASVRKAGDLHH
jgi:hypothetical protein